ncbi:hypothetical protein SAY87_016283 [Trapa incisa]|uniref:Uncharacterized protein n=1 Tax=Trapa incisa TaxID=236973 RepID=A0AAN7L5U4_9MYRT|nr:hypothetical protein SAY87_016283 [Trapa incisa]
MTGAGIRDTFISMDMEDKKNIFTSYPAEVDRHVSFLTAFEDEVIGAEHAFLGHECDKDLVGGHLGFETYDLQKCFSVGNIPSALEYDEIINGDAVGSTLNVGEEAEREFFDGMMQGVDERMHEYKPMPNTSDKHCLVGYSTYKTAGESCLRKKPVPQNEFMALCGSDFEADVSGTSSEISCNGSRNDKNSAIFDKMTVKELQETFRVMFGRETMVSDKYWLKQRLLFGLQNCSRLEENLNLVSMASDEDEEKNMPGSACIQDDGSLVDEKSKEIGSKFLTTFWSGFAEAGTSSQEKRDGGLLVKGKRPHRPPRRYIEESMEPKARSSSSRRCGTFNKASKVKPVVVKPPRQAPRQPMHKGTGAMIAMDEAEPFNGACIQVPFGLPVEEELVKELPSSLALTIVSCLDSDNCPSNQSTISNERSDTECLSISTVLEESISKAGWLVRTDIQKGKRRRKHHIPWTQPEVMKLIEGISQLGVGRWSKIKKLLFSSSKHRTSVDLKDKWRNLVKASCTQLRKKKKGLQGQKHLTHQAPEHVLRRVRELAKL